MPLLMPAPIAVIYTWEGKLWYLCGRYKSGDFKDMVDLKKHLDKKFPDAQQKVEPTPTLRASVPWPK